MKVFKMLDILKMNEHTNYEPLSFEEVEERIKKRWADTGYAPVGKAWGNGSGSN